MTIAPIAPIPPAKSPKLVQFIVYGAVALGVLALGLSVKNAVDLDAQADAREVAAVAADLKVCQQTNELRTQIIAIGEAAGALVDGILDVSTAARADDPSVIAFLTQLEPLFEEYEQTVAAIESIRCHEKDAG